MDEDIIKLQSIIQHQAEDIASLSQELYTQQKELAVLKTQVAAIVSRMKTLSDSAGIVKDATEETPPPHY